MRISDWSSDVCSSDLFSVCRSVRRSRTFNFLQNFSAVLAQAIACGDSRQPLVGHSMNDQTDRRTMNEPGTPVIPMINWTGLWTLYLKEVRRSEEHTSELQ